MNPPLKSNAIRVKVAIEVIATDIKGETRRDAKHPLQGLGFDFHIFKLMLGRLIPAIRAVPVTKVHPLATGFPGDTPVGDLMQRAGVEPVSEDDPVIRDFFISRKIDRFVIAFNQTGIKIVGKAAVKNINQLLSLLSMRYACLGVAFASIDCALSVYPSPKSQVWPTVRVCFSDEDFPVSTMSLESLLAFPFTAT